MIEIEKIDCIKGQDIYLFKLKNEFLDIGIINFGGIIKYFNVKTKEGHKNIVFGIESIGEYLKNDNYSSAIVGRVSNIIENGRFTLNGKKYQITQNVGEHSNHGGVSGFDKRVFNYKTEGDCLSLFLTSPDGDQGFEGALSLEVKYILKKNELEVRFCAKSDKDTVFAPTYHPYFNLSDFEEAVYDTQLKINSDAYGKIDERGIPTGELENVCGTPFDFREFKKIGQDIFSKNEQLKLAGGYDHCFIAKENYMATAFCEKTGIKLEIYSDMPAVQLYTANECTSNSRFFRHCAFCIEPQFFGNALNLDGVEKPYLKENRPVEYYIKFAVCSEKSL